VQQQAHLYAGREAEKESTEAKRALDAFWLNRGMRKQPMRSHLVEACLQVRVNPHERRNDLVGSHGRWKRPCLQTAHMTI
jgi:hypothetical protein